MLLRELNARFGRDNIGILWLIGEPLLFALVVSLVRTVRGGIHGNGVIQPAMFVLVGYTGFIIYRGLFNRAGSILGSSLPLLFHRSVTLMDMVSVRVVIEVVGCFSAYLVLMVIFSMVGIGSLPYRPLYLLAGYGLITWFSAAASMIVMYITFDRPTLERMMHMISYFMIPISGAFFMIEWLPSSFRDIIVWNPLAISFEILRYGQFEMASADYLFFGYALSANAVLTYIGLLLLRRLRRMVHPL